MSPGLQDKLDLWKRKDHVVHSHEKLLTHDLHEALPRLYAHSSTRALEKSDLYQGLRPQIEHVIGDIEYGFYNEDAQALKSKEFYRAVFWNLSGQVNYESLAALIDRHPLLNKADIFYFAHTDIGRERSGGRNLIRSLALEKSYNYVASCSWLHLNSQTTRKPMLDIEGSAIMSKYPIGNFRLIPIPATHDSMRGQSKKIGGEKALLADVTLAEHKLTALVLALDAYSSPRQRAACAESVLSKLHEEEIRQPLLVAGDFQATGYNARGHLSFLLNMINKIFRGVDYIAKEHHLNPHLFFDKALFETLSRYGFDFQNLNEMNKLSAQRKIEDFLKQNGASTRLVSRVLNALKSFFFPKSDRMAFRPDWFAGNACIHPAQAATAEKPRVIENYSLDDSQMATHTPLLLDFTISGAAT